MSRQFHALAACEQQYNGLCKGTALITRSVKFSLHISWNREKGSDGH